MHDTSMHDSEFAAAARKPWRRRDGAVLTGFVFLNDWMISSTDGLRGTCSSCGGAAATRENGDEKGQLSGESSGRRKVTAARRRQPRPSSCAPHGVSGCAGNASHLLRLDHLTVVHQLLVQGVGELDLDGAQSWWWARKPRARGSDQPSSAGLDTVLHTVSPGGDNGGGAQRTGWRGVR